MALARRMSLTHSQVFPHAAFALGAAEPVADFDAPKREDGTRPQVRDKDTGQLVWLLQVLDADPEAGKKDKTINVKVLADVCPVLPENPAGLPFVPVEFEGLTGTPYIDDNGNRPRLAWSFRATAVVTPRARAAGKGGE